MRVISIKKINLFKLYFFATIGLLIFVPIMLLSIVSITKIFPRFEAVNLVIIIISIIFSFYIFKFLEKKSITTVKMKLNNQMIKFNDEVVLLENIKKITEKDFRRYYPIIIFKLNNRKKISIRFSDYQNFWSVYFALKSNPKASRLIYVSKYWPF